MVITPKLNVLLQPIKDKYYSIDRGLDIKVGDEDVRIPEPMAQLLKAQTEDQLLSHGGTATSLVTWRKEWFNDTFLPLPSLSSIYKEIILLT